MKYCYNYNIKKSKVKDASAKNIDIDFAVDFKNNSDIEAQIDGYTFDVLLNNVRVSEVTSGNKEIIKASDFTTIIVPIKLNLSNLLSKKLINQDFVKNIIFDKSKIMVGIKGFVSGGALGVKLKDMEIEISYSLAELLKPSKEPTVECK